MTEKTDKLTLQQLKDVRELCLPKTAWRSIIDELISARDQLEAERQQREAAEKLAAARLKAIDSTHKNRVGWRERATKAEAELSALRGEQEPDHYHLHTPATGANIYYPASQKQIVEAIKDDLSDDVVVTPLFTQQAKPVVVLSEWIKVSDRMPLEAPPEGTYADVEVLVTDGLLVEQMLCASGNPLTDKGYKPWVSFSDYGAISPEEITHWMPLPAVPKPEAAGIVVKDGE